MVKVRFEKKEYDIVKKFEKIHHPDIWKWVIEKVGGKNVKRKVLAISDEPSIFALMLAEQCPNYEVICAIQNEMPKVDMPSNATVLNITSFEDAQKAGKVDVVLLLELTKEAGDLEKLLIMYKGMLASSDGKVVLMARPKNPQLPLPDCCTPFWRKLSFTREEILSAVNGAELASVSYSASVPITVAKFDWEAILFTGCIPVVKVTPKCTEQEITNFCKGQSPKMAFEEKINLFVLKIKS